MANINVSKWKKSIAVLLLPLLLTINISAEAQDMEAQVDPCANPTIVGTDGNNTIYGTSGNDIIDAKGGDDIICGRGGNDKLYGGNDDDYLYGGYGNDELDSIDDTAYNDIDDGGPGTDACISDPDFEFSCES